MFGGRGGHSKRAHSATVYELTKGGINVAGEELEVSLQVNGREVATTRVGWPNPYEIEHGGRKWYYSGDVDGKGRPVYTDKAAKVDFR